MDAIITNFFKQAREMGWRFQKFIWSKILTLYNIFDLVYH